MPRSSTINIFTTEPENTRSAWSTHFCEHKTLSTTRTTFIRPSTAYAGVTRPIHCTSSISPSTPCAMTRQIATTTPLCHVGRSPLTSHNQESSQILLYTCTPSKLIAIISHPSLSYQTHTRHCETGTRPPSINA
jgi:hypothetical protein